jgi:hypothetical protein
MAIPHAAPAALLAATLAAISMPGAAAPVRSGGDLPRLRSLSVSTGLYLDRWGGSGPEGNGFGWRRKSVLYNPPQTLAGLAFAAGASLSPRTGVSLAVPFHSNTIDAYTSSRSGLSLPARRASGIGDIELSLPVRLGPATVQPSLAVPWAYRAEYLDPWEGLGVYRAGLAAFASRGPHGFWAAGDLVAWNPRGDRAGLVEPLDYALKGGYGWKRKLAPRLAGRMGADLSFTSFRWAGDDPQLNGSVDPRIGLAWSPAPGHDLSGSASATLYSWQGGSRTYHTYASRRIGFGLQYGRNF